MRLFKFFALMGFITTLALTYIHMQMEIIDLAYQGNQKEQQIRKFVEENGSKTYKILMLKSANHLGGEMLEDESGMQFADIKDIIEISSSDEFFTEGQLGRQPKLAKKTNSLLSLLSFSVEAEAKTAE